MDIFQTTTAHSKFFQASQFVTPDNLIVII